MQNAPARPTVVRVRIVAAFVAILCGSVFASPAGAHLGLDYPPSRHGHNVLKLGPCGLGADQRGSNITTLESGAAIDIVWDEYVDHPGHFRIAFDIDGEDDFVDPPCLSGCNSRDPVVELYSNDSVLLDGIADTDGGRSSVRVTLPDVECDNCTLQVIQVMYDKPPYVLGGDDIYYQCADLVLRRDVALTPTATASPEVPTPSPPCSGDCDGSGAVSVDEIVTLVAMALGIADAGPCDAGDTDQSDTIEVNEIVAALRRSLEGCEPL